jgi:serine/threonine protein kinase
VYRRNEPTMLDVIAEDAEQWEGFVHPSLVPVLRVQHTRDRLVIVFGDDRGPALVDGAKLLPDPVERELWATTELAGVADALAAMSAHVENFVHRSASHDQIVVGADGHARIRSPTYPRHRSSGWLGRGERIVGLQWLSPELALGKPLRPASDVFQLALTLYVALTLRQPFRADSEFDTLKAVAKGPPPPPPACSPALAALVMKNLARDPRERDRDPATLAANLRSIHSTSSPALCARVAAARPHRHPPPHESAAITGSRCVKRWEELAATDVDGVRHCKDCGHDVVEVRSVAAVIPLLGNRCIAYRPE